MHYFSFSCGTPARPQPGENTVLFWSSMQASYWQEGEWVLLMCFLDEIQTMFPQLANQPSRVLPADMFTDHLLKNQRLMVLRKIKKGKFKARQFLFIIFWLFTRLLILCHSSVFGLHIFLLNKKFSLRRVWNTQYITVKSHQRVELCSSVCGKHEES